MGRDTVHTASARASRSLYRQQVATARVGLTGGRAAGVVGHARPGRRRAIWILAARLTNGPLRLPLRFSAITMGSPAFWHPYIPFRQVDSHVLMLSLATHGQVAGVLSGTAARLGLMVLW